MGEKQYFVIDSFLLKATISLLLELPIRMSDEVKPIIDALAQSPKAEIKDNANEDKPKK